MTRKPLENLINYYLKILSPIIQYIILKKNVRFTGKKLSNIKIVFFSKNYCGSKFNATFFKFILQK